MENPNEYLDNIIPNLNAKDEIEKADKLIAETNLTFQRFRDLHNTQRKIRHAKILRTVR